VTSGNSSLAMWRTSSNSSVRVPPAGIVPVAAPSNPYGTSTPGVLRPSERRNTTRYRLTVISLFGLGAGTVVAPMSFGDIRSVTRPRSLKIVGHGLEVLQPPPVVTLVTTSDSSVPEYAPGVGAPRDASNWSMTR